MFLKHNLITSDHDFIDLGLMSEEKECGKTKKSYSLTDFRFVIYRKPFPQFAIASIL